MGSCKVHLKTLLDEQTIRSNTYDMLNTIYDREIDHINHYGGN